jgi:hypothetical protein
MKLTPIIESLFYFSSAELPGPSILKTAMICISNIAPAVMTRASIRATIAVSAIWRGSVGGFAPAGMRTE